MSTEKPQTGPWGRRLWNAVAILTAIGLLGPVVIVDIAAAPAIAGALAMWPLLTRGRLWVRAVEFVIIAVIALPMAWLYGFGVTNDIRTALTTPPTPPAYLSAPQGPIPGCASRPGPL